MKEVECKYCHKTFPYSKAKANRVFCSSSCHDKYYGKKEQHTEERICPICNKTFEWSSSRPTKKFCSRDCAQKAQQSYIKKNQKTTFATRNCSICGKTFEPKSATQKYCSEECRTVYWNSRLLVEAKKENRSCKVCGKEFVWSSTKPGQIYCSDECRYVAQLQKIKNASRSKSARLADEIDAFVTEIVTDLIKRSTEAGAQFNGYILDYWKIGDISDKTREIVLDRDKRMCRICSRDTDLQLHHIIKRKCGGDHTPENLITLCASCHRHIETGDLDHAIRMCTKNRRKYYSLPLDDSETKEQVILQSVYSLKNIYSELIDRIPDEKELLVRIDSVISNIESKYCD